MKKPLRNRIECVKLILEAGGDPNIADLHGGVPVEYVRIDSTNCTEEEISQLDQLRDLLDSYAPASNLHEFLEGYDLMGMKEYLKEQKEWCVETGGNMEEEVNAARRGVTPLRCAVSLLLDDVLPATTNEEEGEEIEFTTDDKNRRCQTLRKMIMLLLKYGAYVNITTCANGSEEGACTALHDCVIRTCEYTGNLDDANNLTTAALDLMEMLLKQGKSNPNIPSDDGVTPLYSAMNESLSYGVEDTRRDLCLKVATVLVTHGAKFTPDENSGKPLKNKNALLLHDAARRGSIPVIQFLLHYKDVVGVDIDLPGRQGLTPLHFAARSGKADAAKLLLDAGCHVEPKDDRGKTPLDSAIVNKKQDVVDLLEDYMKGK
eukprot:CAMPEP_0195520622 /NCGR_PEP_ID=MMETSP0794_2-20130614/17297_1 /TAXON_ID=515487 /ORGANISM="Stephanopyxis turris, Strain CCMP 815" /LENGTH=374 /DNA_ID=CAMNT_0040650019 /DNA_START=342 /DNA_END=1466 /DNA_ORIENTATION=-